MQTDLSKLGRTLDILAMYYGRLCFKLLFLRSLKSLYLLKLHFKPPIEHKRACWK